MFQNFDFTKAFAASPAVDLKGILELQERNVQALVQANTRIAEGAQTLLQRQAELVQGMVKESLDAARDSLNGKGLNVNVEKQLDYFKTSTEKGVATARELAEMATQVGTEAAEILRKRVNDSVTEWSALVKTA